MKTKQIKIALKKPIIVLYHGDIDGFGAAWAAWKVLGNKADYVEAKHQTPPPEGLKNKKVIFVDFCYNEKETMSKILSDNKEVAIIDHHLSNKENGEKNSTEFIFDNNHSGAFLAWKYFHPKKKTPRLIAHIEDIDLWKFKMAGTKELMVALDVCDFDFKLWDKIAADIESANRRKKHFETGVAILKYLDKMMEKNMEGGEDVLVGGREAFAVNSSGIDPSELGNLIARKKKKIGLIWRYEKGRLKVSLRSTDKLKADVSQIAAAFGGGGHRNSSGFVILDPKMDFPWKKKQDNPSSSF